ncbi:histidine phosphatase family protein [Natronosporangium hydrolyticum]|uniref:Histidine phosphatase family protein n=1 Tax=Natronosporangium hydrolyticum TaxID=2811111 RepID=A0A895Y500_9ACTN|nr:histidine phosphatase family protein [Natronosporangium hydrolyticum]QSB12767.1 histidine phosphatase family protein [Natronosporangium hydrolyticum]
MLGDPVSGQARLLLVRHAPTAATRAHAFPGDEPLDPAGRSEAAALRGRLPAGRAISSPAQRCQQTAALAGFADVELDPRWSELNFGGWAGLRLADAAERDPEQVSAWLDDPAHPPPGGEGVEELLARVRAALAELSEPGTTVVFTSGGPIKAAVLAVLAAPVSSLWRVEVAPCTVTILYGPHPQWQLRAGFAGAVADA